MTDSDDLKRRARELLDAVSVVPNARNSSRAAQLLPTLLARIEALEAERDAMAKPWAEDVRLSARIAQERDTLRARLAKYERALQQIATMQPSYQRAIEAAISTALDALDGKDQPE